MTDREKLVKLLDEAHDNYYKSFDPNRDFYGGVADHLIANGVTFATDTNVGSKVETNIFDQEELHHNCTVQILRNSVTGEQSIGWWKENEQPKEV